MSIKLLANDDRPREKFLLKGKNSLSDSELLAIIMSSGNKEETAVELARRILQSVNNDWNQLSLLTVKDLMKFKGVGEAKAISIATALEIGKRRSLQEIVEKISINSSKEAFQLLEPYLSDLRTEEFWVIFLNQSNKVIEKAKLFSGGINQSVVDVRIILKYALDNFATGIIVAHNHPSGNTNPSEEDLLITKNIAQAGKILNVQLLDHLIINQKTYFSFADENML